MSTITLHNLDSELDKRLRSLALNRAPMHDFSEFLNTWTNEEALEFESATAELSLVDADEWL